MKLGIISGTSINASDLFKDWEKGDFVTSFGNVPYRYYRNIVIINRHGREGTLPPHAINHRANLQALQRLACTNILSLNSVGSLKPDLPPGTLLSCGDYVSFAPSTFSDDEGKFLAPVVPNGLIPEIADLLGEPLPQNKVYVQTRGPRFETPAEVRVVQHWGDVVGMTMASEADLANELGIDYNSLAMVDNFANGMGEEPLTLERFRERLKANQGQVNAVLAKVLKHYFS